MNAASPTPVWTPGFPVQRPVPRHTLEAFLAVEFLCQLALLVPGLNAGPLRVLWRVGIFALSIALIAVLRGRRRASPAAVAAFWVMALMTVELFHPTGNTVLSVVAQWGMYLAVLAPLFWMPRLEVTPRMFRRVLLLFWGFYSLSALVGVLQVYDPGQFQPQLSPVVASMGDAIQGLKITLANGATIFRPMGLTDMPGGAASAGMWAVLFGLGLLLTLPQGRPWLLKRAAFLGSMLIGVGCIYLSQVRVLMVVVAVWMAAFLGFLLWRRRWRQFLVLALMAAAVGGGAWVIAARLGGANMTARAATVEGAQKTRKTFTLERGAFVRQTFTSLIPTYPLGAGLGRWGMMNSYFGDNTNPDRGRIYVEIQWQGWVLDGGVPMLIAYLALLATAMLMLWRIARRRGPMAVWALLCLAYDVGVIAFSFDYTPFTGEAGMEFWFINALVLAAAAYYRRQMAAAAAPANGAGMGKSAAWVLVAADFVKTGGMDRANYALAEYLARLGREVHLVGHAAAPALLQAQQLHWHPVPRPLGRDALGWGALDRAGRHWALRLRAGGGRIVVNGGNCQWGDVNWVHYVHAAYRSPLRSANPLAHAWHGWKHQRARRDEAAALARAHWVVANSERTRRDLIQLFDLPPARVRTIYYGCDPERFRPVSAVERAAARCALGWDPGRRTALFIGALGDRRKGFDTLWAAWQRLCADAAWDVDLAVAGRGAELAAWRRRLAAVPNARCALLGFRTDVPALLAASDVLVAPTRYEAYGLGVQEALAAGLPALVSATAGVAERLPPALDGWRLQDPESEVELEQRLRTWRQQADAAPWRPALEALSQQLRARTWDTMAAEIVALREAA